jgi:hypothetical protein
VVSRPRAAAVWQHRPATQVMVTATAPVRTPAVPARPAPVLRIRRLMIQPALARRIPVPRPDSSAVARDLAQDRPVPMSRCRQAPAAAGTSAAGTSAADTATDIAAGPDAVADRRVRPVAAVGAAAAAVAARMATHMTPTRCPGRPVAPAGPAEAVAAMAPRVLRSAVAGPEVVVAPVMWANQPAAVRGAVFARAAAHDGPRHARHRRARLVAPKSSLRDAPPRSPSSRHIRHDHGRGAPTSGTAMRGSGSRVCEDR